MATRLYLHVAASALSNLPTAEQSTLTSDKNADAQTVNRSMNTTIGTGFQSVSIVALAQTSQQTNYFTRFVSQALSGISSISANTWTVVFGCVTTNSSGRFPTLTSPLKIVIYVWRPSTQTKVANIFDGNSVENGSTATTSSPYRMYTLTCSGAAVSGIQDGDVICYEAWFQYTQSVAGAYTNSLLVDGTLYSGGTTTDPTAYIETPQNLTFSTTVTVNAASIQKYKIRQLATNLDTHKYKMRVLATNADTHRYKIRKLTGQSSDTIRYKIRKLTGQSTDTLRYKIRQVATSTDTIRYKIRKLATNADTFRYKIRKLTGQNTDIFRYKIRKLTGQKTNTHRYKMRQVATNVDTHRYKIRKLVTDIQIFRYDINRLTGQKSNTFRYKIRKLASQTDTHQYKIRKLTGQKTNTHRYKIRKLVTSVRIFRYKIPIQFTRSSRTFLYKIRKTVNNPETHKYNIRKLATNQDTHRYKIRQRVFNADTHRYKVRQVATSVDTHRYKIRKLATKAYILRYKIRKLTGQSTDTIRYKIRKVTGQKSYIFKYKIRKLTGLKANTFRYKLRQLATNADIHRYKIRQLATNVDTIRYNIRQAVCNMSMVRYAIKVKVASSDTYRYKIRKLTGVKTITLRYKIRTLASKAYSFRYAIIVVGVVSRVLTFRYKIRKTTANTDTYRYKIRRLVTKYAIFFDGVNDYLNCGNQATLWSQALTKFSMSMWVYAQAQGGTRYIVYHGASPTPQTFALYQPSSTVNRFTFRIVDAAAGNHDARVDHTEDILNKWVLITCVYDSTAASPQVKVYCNLKPQDLGSTCTETINASQILTIAQSTADFQGYVRDFRWYTNYALSPAEIALIYKNDPGAPVPHYWLPMTEGSGNPVDSIGAKTTTLTNGASWIVIPSLNMAYKIRGLTGQKTNTFRYKIRKLTARSIVLNYNIRQWATRPIVLKYNIRILTGLKANTFRYKIRKLTGLKANTFRYKIRKLTGQKSYILRYKIRILTGQKANIFRYKIRKLVANVDTHKYNIRKIIARAGTFNYKIRQLVGSGAVINQDPTGGATPLITIPNITAINNLDSFTLSIWVNPFTWGAASTPHILTKGYPGNDTFILYFNSANGVISWRIQGSDGSLKNASSSFPIPLNKDTHIIARFDRPTGTIRLRLNGAQDNGTVQLVVTPNAIGGIANLLINGAGASANKWGGKVTDFRLFRTALSDADCNKVYRNDPTAPTPDYWLPLNEGFGSPKASIPLGNTATLSATGIKWISDGITQIYKISILTGQKTGIFRYAIRKLTGQKVLIARYKIRKVIARTGRFIYNIVEVGIVTRQLRFIYNVRQLSTRPQTFRYKIRKKIAKANTFKYKIRKLTGQSTLIYRYKIRQLVCSLQMNRYRIRKLIARTNTHAYNIRTLTGQNVATLRYAIRELATAEYRFIYQILIVGIVTKALIAKYNIRKLTGQRTQTHRYAIRLRTGMKSLTMKYNIRGLVANTQTHSYRILSMVLSTISFHYNMREAVRSTNRFVYGIGGFVARELRFPYRILGKTSVTYKFLYKINPFSPSQILKPEKQELNLPHPSSKADLVGNKGKRISIGSIIDTGLYYFNSLGEKIRIRKVKW